MATATTTPEPNYFQARKGIKNWLYTLDHKRIGLMYLFGILGALLLGGFFALLVRLELFSAGEQISGPELYNRFFTLHGAVMVFLVIIPGIPAALGNLVLPLQLGAAIGVVSHQDHGRRIGGVHTDRDRRSHARHGDGLRPAGRGPIGVSGVGPGCARRSGALQHSDADRSGRGGHRLA